MNAKGILEQLMHQASGSRSQGTGSDVSRLMKNLSAQLGGGRGQSGGNGAWRSCRR